MLRIVPPTVPRVGRSDEHFPDGFELHLLPPRGEGAWAWARREGEDVHDGVLSGGAL